MSDLKWFGKSLLLRVATRLALIAIFGALAYMGIGKAHAASLPQDPSCYAAQDTGTCNDQGHALNAAMVRAEWHKRQQPANNNPAVCTPILNVNQYSIKVVAGGPTCPNGAAAVTVQRSFGQNCSTRSPKNSGFLNRTLQPGLICSEGCRYTLAATEQGTLTTGAGAIVRWAEGVLTPSGATCALSSPAENGPINDMPACVDNGGGYKTCKKPNDKTCIVSPAGKEFCYATNEHGPKVDNARTEGTGEDPGTDTPPPPVNRPGEDFQPPPNTQPATETDEVNGPTRTINPVINYGPPNLNPGDRTPGDGGDTGSEGEGGEGDEDGDGETSGGESCESPPVCSGDAVMCGVLNQTWQARCAPYDDGGQTPEDGDMGEESDPGDIISDEEPEEGDGLDDSGFGWARSCPEPISVNVFGNQIEFDTTGVLCNWLQLGGALVLMFAALAAARILGGAV